MNKSLLALLIFAAPATASAQFDFSIKNMMRGPEIYGREPQNVRWSADGKWIYFSWLEAGSDWRQQSPQLNPNPAAHLSHRKIPILASQY